MEEVYDSITDINTDISDASKDESQEALTQEEEQEKADTRDYPDYEAIIASDVSELSSEFPELKNLKDITELNNPLRYAALRDLGLTPAEAYLATAKRPTQDTRAHLKSAHGRSAVTSIGMMSQEDLSTARELFPSLSDSELQKLYKKVTK